MLKGSDVVFSMYEMINLERRAAGGGFLAVHILLMLVLSPQLPGPRLAGPCSRDRWDSWTES